MLRGTIAGTDVRFEQPVELARRKPDAACRLGARQRLARVALHQFQRCGKSVVMHAITLGQGSPLR
jgi:hypothetical protein